MLINLNCRGILAGFALMFCTSTTIFAQNACSYQIIQPGNYGLSQLKAALDGAALDAYRFKTQRRTLAFDQGAKVELLSSLELSMNGCPVDAIKAMPDNTPIAANRTFTIHSTGVLVEVVGPRIKE